MEEPLKWTDIEGWLTEAEGNALRVLAIGSRVLELGSWKGRSTVAMALVANRVVSVDHHGGDVNTGPQWTFPEFRANLKLHGVAHKVDRWVCSFLDYDRNAAVNPRFDLTFIDGEHSEESTMEAMRIARWRTRQGGYIAWHDCDYPSVKTAADRAGLVAVACVDRLAWAAN